MPNVKIQISSMLSKNLVENCNHGKIWTESKSLWFQTGWSDLAHLLIQCVDTLCEPAGVAQLLKARGLLEEPFVTDAKTVGSSHEPPAWRPKDGLRFIGKVWRWDMGMESCSSRKYPSIVKRPSQRIALSDRTRLVPSMKHEELGKCRAATRGGATDKWLQRHLTMNRATDDRRTWPLPISIRILRRIGCARLARVNNNNKPPQAEWPTLGCIGRRRHRKSQFGDT